MGRKRHDRDQLVQVLFRIHRALLKEVKGRALYQNLSMQSWITKAMMEKIAREDLANQPVVVMEQVLPSMEEKNHVEPIQIIAPDPVDHDLVGHISTHSDNHL